MTYQYDIFISYRRNRTTEIWLRDDFEPMLYDYLAHMMPQKPKIFIDNQIEVGDIWPSEIAVALATSRVQIPLLSYSYFYSNWCLREIQHMRRRMKITRKRLIFPFVISGIETPFACVNYLEAIDFQEFYSSSLGPKCEKRDAMETAMKRITPKLSKRIANAPDWSETWLKIAYCQVRMICRTNKQPEQQNVPKLR